MTTDVSERKIRFTSNHSSKDLLKRIEDIVTEMTFAVQKKNGKLKVMQENKGQKSPASLLVAAEVFEISPSLDVVELRKAHENSSVYRQDTFHEVKRKRDRRKENLNNKEAAESRWRPGTQGRGSRGSRVNYSSRYVSHDTGGGRNSASGKENGINQVSEKGVTPLPISPETRDKETSSIASSATIMANGSTNVASGDTSNVHVHLYAGSDVEQLEVSPSSVDVDELGSALPPTEANENPPLVLEQGMQVWSLCQAPIITWSLITPVSSLPVCFSSSDPILVPSIESRVPKREVGSQRTPVESNGLLL